MEKRLVYHHNLIGHEINESLECYAEDVFDREIYCRKRHQVLEPLEKDCIGCPYYEGREQGYGHECVWEDVTDREHVIRHEDRYKEYERVDRLIKLGVIERHFYDKNKWIYKESYDSKNRFLLGTKGNRTLICCGVNPSVASPENLDPTMKIVDAFAKANGYDSYIMINLYPMRATNPNDMHETVDKNIMKENLEYIESILSNGNCDIWAAWGALIKARLYLKDCLQQIVDIADTYNCSWYTIGEKTKEGHPHHPLYLNKQCSMERFDIHEYFNGLC